MATLDSTSPKSKSRAKIYADLLRDKRVSHGAFRLWHCLRDYWNPRTGFCWPGQRTIAQDIGCKVHSLKAWTEELEQAQWLSVQRAKAGRSFKYFILDGTGEPLPKTATPTDAQKGNTSHRCLKRQHTDAQKGYGPLPKGAYEVIPPLKKGGKRKKLKGCSSLNSESPLASGTQGDSGSSEPKGDDSTQEMEGTF